MYHAGNLADVHKHMLLAWILTYLTRKEKPLTYIETHAGRGAYDLSDTAAAKTSEAAAGIDAVFSRIDAAHPYARALRRHREQHGPRAYPGSPMIAAQILRKSDAMHLAELHPREFHHLEIAMSPYPATCRRMDGFELAHSICPPTPRRGLLLIDPSYEIKTDYSAIPKHIAKITTAWNLGIICLWYPLLKSDAHQSMLNRLRQRHPDALRHEVSFETARKGHGMIGSGMIVINAPHGLSEEAARISRQFQAWAT
jgi:23S rRNA (adenine2030-N6)-methyltransferase